MFVRSPRAPISNQQRRRGIHWQDVTDELRSTDGKRHEYYRAPDFEEKPGVCCIRPLAAHVSFHKRWNCENAPGEEAQKECGNVKPEGQLVGFVATTESLEVLANNVLLIERLAVCPPGSDGP